ncbi:hypothetical protein SteCoe_36731 [Stentor coeruleus]|uniref:Ankyrin repeat domain-containing protein n=1 Tax=Stentor coeruleus TaxID=5963 RepID=A0A1R2APQ5_9CILI|nr:hypothetical protein SteCoe_36731 [Stentor coeruleus]
MLICGRTGLSTFSNFRSKINADLWENWVIRRILYGFHVFQEDQEYTTKIYSDMLGYIKNVMPIPEHIEDLPLHRAVIERKLFKIRQICIGDDCNYFHIHIDQPDSLGNTALMLAVKLKLHDEVQVLIDHGSDPKYRMSNLMPSPIELAIAMEDKTLLKKLVVGYHQNLHSSWNDNIEDFAETLISIPDFSIKMKWECVSKFIPFLKKFTPSDEYYICKKGNKLKIDLTLIGWEQLRAKRGRVSLLFDGDFYRVIIIDHDKNTSRELFTDLSIEQIDKHTEELLKNKKFSGDLLFSDCSVVKKKSWRGLDQYQTIDNFSCNQYSISCSLALSFKKRQVLIEKELSKIQSFEEYFLICQKDSNKSLMLASKLEKNSNKHIKANLWCAEDFPIKIADLMPLLDLLASVSQKAKRFHEFLSSNQMFYNIGFPLKAKIPLMLTVTALVAFKELKTEGIEDSEFDFGGRIAYGMISCLEIPHQITSYESECSEQIILEDSTLIGPKLALLPTPQLQDDSEEEKTILSGPKSFVEESREKLKLFESRSLIMGKVKLYLESLPKSSNDIDIII